MKKLIYLLLIMAFFTACEKQAKWDNPKVLGLPVLYTNYYILTDIEAETRMKDTINSDTVKYDLLYITIKLDGNIVSENTAFSDIDCSDSPNPYCTPPIEQKYFINKIQKIEITSNKTYYTNENKIENLDVYFRDKKNSYKKEAYMGKEFGYQLKIKLPSPPDNSDWFIFTIRITDDKNNVFTCSTDSIFILK